MPFQQASAVMDNSENLENQTNLQHSSPAPGSSSFTLKFNPVQQCGKAHVQVRSKNAQHTRPEHTKLQVYQNNL